MAADLATQERPQLDIDAEILTSRSARLQTADILRVLDYHAQGVNQVDIARIVGCSQSTVSRTLADAKRHAESVQQLMTAGIADSLECWDEAQRIAAKRGDHRPARERIEMALPTLRPQPANSGTGGGVTINIGMPGKPIGLPTIEVVSPRQLTGESETPSDR